MDMQTFLIYWIQFGIRGVSTWQALTESEALSGFRFHKPKAIIIEIA